MENKNNSLVKEGSVWDLHIHTCKCPKSSGSFKQLTEDEFIDKLDGIFSDYNDLKMISFTDHNSIDVSIYKKSFERFKNKMSIIIGIEVDVYLDEKGKNNNQAKHVVFYFDPSRFNLDLHSRLINEKLSGETLLLDTFLNFMITEIKVPFIISPHFMKQDGRGVEYHWADEEEIKKNIDKYIDQMFCIWETSSIVSYNYAIQYVKQYDRDEKVSIIAFSDSHGEEKLRKYLDNPHQYFNALPSFMGLRMVASDCRRITRNKMFVEEINAPNYIGCVKQGNNIIFFNQKLNAVIGGRGSGKSLLLDGITYFLDKDKITGNDSYEERKEYIEKLDYEVFDLNGNSLFNHDFKFDYFNQGYVLELFNKNHDMKSIIEFYFKDEFSGIEDFDIDETRNKIKEDLRSAKASQTTITDNISSLSDKIKVLDSDSNDVSFLASRSFSPTEYKGSESIIDNLTKPSIVPSDLKNNPTIVKAAIAYAKVVETEIYSFNNSGLEVGFQNRFHKKYEEYKSAKSQNRKDKADTIKGVQLRISNELLLVANRVRIINKFISNKSIYSDVHKTTKTGFDNHSFIFTKELIVEPIMSFLHRQFKIYFDKTKVKNKLNVDRDLLRSIGKLIEGYCYFPEELLMETKKLSDLDDELTSLDNILIRTESEIYYNNGDKTIKLRDVSPGTKANILMEYIVFKDSSIPLLIDQPEDNIDNQTIYKYLTEWFTDLKMKRQVIVATHDANIVVNADAENIIVCKQVENDVFDYKNGALEYDNIIDSVSIILDGGKEALERRLVKYGKNN